jgi:hypothetical protein
MTQIYESPQEALEKAIKIWQLLASGKVLYKEDAYNLLSLPMDKGNCPCCQYDAQFLPSGKHHCCDNCPVKDWGSGESHCLKPKSTYAKWRSSDYSVRAYKAAEVLVILIRALESYDKKEGESNGKPEN